MSTPNRMPGLAKLDLKSIGHILRGHVPVDIGAHGAAALVVWKMSDEDRSPECEETARRLVACWNACDGVSTDYLEGMASVPVPQRATIEGVIDGLAGARDALWKQRDELLIEIERQYTELADYRNNWPGRSTLEGQAKLVRMRDLIAKATGRSEQEVQDDYGTRLARAESVGSPA